MSNKNITIHQVKKDINSFGSSFKVIVVYENEIMTRYVAAHPPFRDQGVHIDVYEKILEKYKANIDTLVGTESKMMTLDQLLVKLVEQDSML